MEPRVDGAIYVSLMFEKGPYEVRGEFLRYRWEPGQMVDVNFDPIGTGSRSR